MLFQSYFSSLSCLKVSPGGHPAAKTRAGLQDCCLPLILGAPCQMLQQGAGSTPTCREDGARLQQLDAKANDPQRDCDKMQGPGNLFNVHAGRKNWGGSEGFHPPKKCMSGTYCDLPCCVWGQKVGVLVARRNPAEGKAPKFSEAMRMLACEGNTEETAM